MAAITTNQMKRIVSQSTSASLSTLQATTKIAYGSLVNVAVDDKGPIILISDLAWHTKNLHIEPHGSLLFVEVSIGADGKPLDPLEGKRLTILGKFAQIDDVEASETGVRDFYLKVHPDAQLFEGFSDFSFWRLNPDTIHAIAGFGAIETIKASKVFG